MPALYTDTTDNTILCRQHVTGQPQKAGHPPRVIELDGRAWTHIKADSNICGKCTR